MIFINFSSDKIFFWIDWYLKILENKGLEESFPSFLADIYQKNNFSEIYVINWPWWFTTLRTCCLSINLLNFVNNYKIRLFEISKIDFYKKLVQNNIIPDKWIIFRWQRKKVWDYDFNQNSYEDLLLSDIENQNWFFFVDYISDEYIEHPNKLSFSFESQKIKVYYKWKDNLLDINDFDFQEVNLLSPNYMVQPTISTPKN